MNLRILTKNHAADPDIGFLTKSISKANGHPDSVVVNKFYFGKKISAVNSNFIIHALCRKKTF